MAARRPLDALRAEPRARHRSPPGLREPREQPVRRHEPVYVPRRARLDLLRHNFEDARELYADLWLGFPEVELETMLHKARFTQVETSLVYREPEPPYFETLLALGVKAK